MSIFIQIFLRSLETGSVYALAALGIILVFKTSNITNFSQGALGMFNTFVVTSIFNNFGVPLWVAILGGLLSAFVIGMMIDLLIIRHTKKVSPVAKQIITLGLIMILVGLAPIFFGVDPLNLPRLLPNGNLTILGANISYNGVFNIIFGLVVMGTLFYVLQYTKVGLAIRTTASNEYTARLMGVPTKTVTLGAWAVGSMLGVISGVMIAPTTTVTLNLMDVVQINAFVAAVLGGFQTFYGPVVGAYIIGVVANLLLFYVSPVWGGQILYVLILLFLTVRPYGLFGKKVVKKV
ncbi:MAG: branched-chain amino acid ABC transporter permease [Erysipelotrichia bacterium]|jgi:branched-chain amino acid transport system permease protein|nr:branched-chain amino acid ABC transporter permease [Erysipelotrichia bacterium]